MSRIVRRRQAIRDVQAIWRHISQNDVQAADRLVRRIDAILDMLADQPRIGTPRDAWLPGARSVVLGKYLILYQPTSDGILLVRVLHSARDLPRIAGDR